jgi:uncharacterized protein YndB with AHSA1/START domain
MEVGPAVSRSTEVPVEPPTAFRLYTAEINRRLVYSWRQADWRPGDELEIEVAFQPAGAGTVVTINVRGWDRIAGGEELGRGYGSGARELLGWYAEAAATA